MNSEAKVGAMAIFGMALLLAIVLYLSGVNFGAGGYPVNAMFSRVDGLKEGNSVNYSGVYIGTVKAIRIAPDGIKVEMLINSDVKIPQNSKFTITSSGILGEQYVNVVPPAKGVPINAYMMPNDVVYGEAPIGIDTMMQLSSEAMQEIKLAVESLNEVLSDKEVKDSLKETIVNLDKLTKSLSEIAVQNQDKINETVLNMAVMSENLKDMAVRFDAMTATIDNNGRTGADLRELVGNLTRASRSLEKMTASMEGVIADPQTAEDLKTIISNTKQVSQKASDMVTKSSLTADTELEMLYDFKDNKYLGNANLKIGRASSPSFAVIGVNDMGGESRLNLQYGRTASRFTERMGIIDGDIGVGADVAFGGKLKLSLDVYDPNDVKYKMRAKYSLMPDLSIIGQTDRDRTRPSKWHNYFGMQRTF